MNLMNLMNTLGHPAVSRFLALLFLAGLAGTAHAQNCSRTSIGATPLNDLGAGKYKGFEGGLYPGGKNTPPAAHAAGGMRQVAAIQRLDAAGKPSPTGKIVVISIGMSNTTQEFSVFVSLSNADPRRKPGVVVVDTAQGGQDARRIADPKAPYWQSVVQKLGRAGVTAQQVQVAWIKEAVARPTKPFPTHARELGDLLEKICQILKQKFPNLRIGFLSSRIYAGYATSSLNPEPYAYESGFAVKWLIEKQISGAASLNWDPTRGAVRSPWLAWGPYLWADGTKGRSDGLKWFCSDFASDGTHPSASGRRKVGEMLNHHFIHDTFARPWYGGGGGGARAAVLPYGEGCRGSRGRIGTRTNSLPTLGNRSFRYGITNARPSSPAVLLYAAARASIPFDGCTVLVDPARLLAVADRRTNTAGATFVGLPIPADPRLAGQSLFTQWVVLDAGAPRLRSLGGAGTTTGVELRFGSP